MTKNRKDEKLEDIRYHCSMQWRHTIYICTNIHLLGWTTWSYVLCATESRLHEATGHFKEWLTAFLTPSREVQSAVEWRGCSIKGKHLSAWHTVQINMKEREWDGTGHSCGHGDHFLPAACSGCFCQCYISQYYTAEHRHHCYQRQTGEESVGCVCMRLWHWMI